MFQESINTFVTHYTGLRKGAEEWEIRLKMIDAANEYLYLSTYYFEYDDFSLEFINRLLSAKKRGVNVHLAYDDFAQRLAGTQRGHDKCCHLDKLLAELVSAGVVVTLWKPNRFPARLLGGGNHIKVQLSEDGAAIFGSSNISGRSIETWNEYSGLLRGPIVDQLRYWFLTATEASCENASPLTKPGKQATAVCFHWCEPWRNQPLLWPLRVQHSSITLLMCDQIDKAQEQILIASFHFKPPTSSSILCWML